MRNIFDAKRFTQLQIKEFPNLVVNCVILELLLQVVA